MRRSTPLSLLAVLAAGCAPDAAGPRAADLSPAVAVAPSVTYTPSNVSSGPNDDSYAEGINDNGVIAGWSNTATGTRPWVRNGTTVAFLSLPPGAIGGQAWAISNNGHIAGTVIYGLGSSQPAYWPSRTSPAPTLISALGAPMGDGLGVNNAGQVAGTTVDPILGRRAILWKASTGVTQDLGTLGGPSAQAFDINTAGTVVGCAESTAGGTHAYSWTSGGGMVALESFYSASCVYGLNNLGDASGWVDYFGADSAAVFLANGVFRRFVGPGATAPNLQDINDGQISVGYWTVAGKTVAIATDPTGASLTTLPTLPTATGTFATAINTCGRIVGYTLGTPHVRSLLWRPPGC
jgi:probable HAF family extracellular repeat protein